MRSGAPSARGDERRERRSSSASPAIDLEPSRPMRGDFGERGEAALVALDRDHLARALREQRARQAAGAGADLDDGDAVERPGGARDAAGQVEIEQEILAERLLRASSPCAATTSRSGGRPSAAKAHGGEPRREPQRGDQARRVGEALAGDVERRAVVGRGAHERQAERDVDAARRRRASWPGSGPGRDTSSARRRSARAPRRGTSCRRAAGRRRRAPRRASSAIAGAMISISSRPIAPPSPACGLRPAKARRGRGDAEAARASRAATMRAVETMRLARQRARRPRPAGCGS